MQDSSLIVSLKTSLSTWQPPCHTLTAGRSSPFVVGPPALLQVHRRRPLVLVPLPEDGRQHQIEQRFEQSIHIVAGLGTGLEAHLARGQAALLVQALVAQDSLVKGHRVLGGNLFVQLEPREGCGRGGGGGAGREHLWLRPPLLTLGSVLRRHVGVLEQVGFWVCEIGLVAHDSVYAVVVGGVSQGQEALLQLGQTLPVGDVVNEDDGGRASAVHGAQSVELFATCRDGDREGDNLR